MDIDKKKEAPLYIGFGLIFQFLYGGLNAMHTKSDIVLIVEVLALLIGAILFLVGCWKLAKGKGYSGSIGLLLGIFLNIAGVIILAIIPDKIKNSK